MESVRYPRVGTVKKHYRSKRPVRELLAYDFPQVAIAPVVKTGGFPCGVIGGWEQPP